MTRYNWDTIRTEYLTGNVSLRALAKVHGCCYASISRVAARQRWSSRRAARRARLAERAEFAVLSR